MLQRRHLPKWHSLKGNRGRRAAGLMAFTGLFLSSALAQADPPRTDPVNVDPPPIVISASADSLRDILRQHWPLIVDRAGPLPPRIDVDRLAGNYDLIQPGAADASELYNRLASGSTAASPRDLKTIRTWIEGLPKIAVTACGDRLPASQSAIAARVAADLQDQLPLRRPKLRYLSLVAMKSRCAPAFADAETAIQSLILMIASSSTGALPTRLDTDGALWRVDLDELKLTPGQWEQLAAFDPLAMLASSTDGSVASQTGSARAIVRADALASALISDPPSGPLASLRLSYREPLDAEAAAAELGLDPAILRKTLWLAMPKAAPDDTLPLLNTVINRARFVDMIPTLTRRLLGLASPPQPPRPPIFRGRYEQPVKPPPLLIATETNKLRTGDLLTFALYSTIDCALEVIDIDPAGRATLLFPNDFQRDNHIRAGQWLTLPGDAAYQLRVSLTGIETLVAECTAPGAKRQRTRTEFVRQRFLDLGNWQRDLGEAVIPAASPASIKSKAGQQNAVVLSRAGLSLTVR